MLEAKKISKQIAGKQILQDVSFVLPDRQNLTIVGPSGVGKTTLLRVLTGLTDFDSGTIELDGQPFRPSIDNPNQGKIGLVFQDFNLFPHLTVLENVALPLTMVEKVEQKTAIEKAQSGLTELGLEKQGNQYPFQLSGGQKQRVAIARALILRPEILAYDEPTSALDPAMSDEVANLINRVKADGLTQIIVTHDPTFAKKVADVTLDMSR